jgi:hypothetical protein
MSSTAAKIAGVIPLKAGPGARGGVPDLFEGSQDDTNRIRLR